MRIRLDAGQAAPDAASCSMRMLHLVSLLLLLGLSSCSWLAHPRLTNTNRVGEVKVIGVVELINPEQNYVLINCEQRLAIPAGTEIIAQNPNGSKAKLKVSPERKGNYITADITEGTPHVHDLVLYQVQPTGSAAPSVPPNSTPATSVSSPAVPLTPVMQADAIPPLNAPFQPMTPVKSTVPPAPPTQALPPSNPSPPPANEPEPDLSKLPPVIR